MQSQTERIKKYLTEHNSITPMQALNKFGCLRLAARIRELRDDGYLIVSTTVTKNGKRYAKYIRAWA